MCHCKQSINKINKVCVKHKQSKKSIREFNRNDKCSICRDDMVDIGSKLNVPKRNDVKRWEHIKMLISTNFYFSVCQCQ